MAPLEQMVESDGVRALRDGTRCRVAKPHLGNWAREHFAPLQRRIPPALLCWLALAVTACVSVPKTSPRAPTATAPAAQPLDSSYDWHGLLLVPFGTVLKDVPFALHEVLVFQADARAIPAEQAECYALEQPAPRLVARIPGRYTLCFNHDRLARVQATVDLSRSEAGRTLADACALWQRNAAAGASAGAPANGVPAGSPAERTPGPAPLAAGAAETCEGRDGTIGYSGRLDRETGEADAVLTLTLDGAAQP